MPCSVPGQACCVRSVYVLQSCPAAWTSHVWWPGAAEEQACTVLRTAFAGRVLVSCTRSRDMHTCPPPLAQVVQRGGASGMHVMPITKAAKRMVLALVADGTLTRGA